MERRKRKTNAVRSARKTGLLEADGSRKKYFGRIERHGSDDVGVPEKMLR